MIPLVVLHGRAGCGKDTVAARMVERYGATTLAFADPFKRKAQEVFGFSDAQLWGPSEARAEPLIVSSEPSVWLKWAKPGGETSPWSWAVEVLHHLETQGDDRVFSLWETWWRSDIAPHLAEGRITPRHVLQTLGSEFGRRAFGADGWTKYALRRAEELLLEGGTIAAPTGVRTPGRRPAFVVITDGRFANEVYGVKKAGGVAVHIEAVPREAAPPGGVPGHLSERDEVPMAWFDSVVFNDKSLGLANLDGWIDYALQHVGLNRGRVP